MTSSIPTTKKFSSKATSFTWTIVLISTFRWILLSSIKKKSVSDAILKRCRHESFQVNAKNSNEPYAESA